jgi:hypothetical protein
MTYTDLHMRLPVLELDYTASAKCISRLLIGNQAPKLVHMPAISLTACRLLNTLYRALRLESQASIKGRKGIRHGN